MFEEGCGLYFAKYSPQPCGLFAFWYIFSTITIFFVPQRNNSTANITIQHFYVGSGLTTQQIFSRRTFRKTARALRRSLSAPARSGSEKGLVTKSISVIAKGVWYKINFSGLQLYRNQVRTNSDYRICTCSILYGLVSNPALPPESLGQIGFDVVGNGLLLRSEWAGLENADLGSEWLEVKHE